MPVDPNTVAPNGVVDLSDSPVKLDDATFDQLFPAEPQTVVVATTQPNTQPNTQTQATQTPVVQTPNAPFLKGDKSVYNTADAAIQGINQKDALIETLRQRYALTTGVDPITGQPIGQVQSQEVDYATNPQQYMKDLYEAAKQGPEAYSAVQTKFQMDNLKPLQPLIQKVAREQALQSLALDPVAKDASKFVGTPAYQAALDGNPELKNAIAVAESDSRWHSRLAGLYKIAYLTGQGLQLPELLRTNTPSTQTQTQQVQTRPQIRPTAQSTTPSMPTQTAQPSFRNLEGIRAVIAQAEANGAKLEF